MTRRFRISPSNADRNPNAHQNTILTHYTNRNPSTNTESGSSVRSGIKGANMRSYAAQSKRFEFSAWSSGPRVDGIKCFMYTGTRPPTSAPTCDCLMCPGSVAARDGD